MVSMMEPVELRSRGFDALVKELGWVDAVRFMMQFERSTFNYVEEREAMLPEVSMAELMQKVREVEQAESLRS